MGRCFIKSTRLTPHLFLLGWLKLSLVLLLDQLSRNRCFLVAPCHLIVRRLGSSNQEASLLAGKNTRIVLVPCCAWKCVPTANSGGKNISEVPGCHLLQHISSQCGSQKLLQGLVSHELTACLSVFNLFLTQ